MATEQLERRTWKVAEAAQMSGLGKDKIYELIAKGEMPGRRLGRRVVIPKRAFDEWLEKYLSGQYGKVS